MLGLKAQGDKIGTLDPSMLHYMSLSWLEDGAFGRARLMCEMTDMWLEKKISMPGYEFKQDPPKLSEAELAKVPGASAATTSIDKLKLEVCCRDGSRIILKPDEERYWASQGGTIGEEFAALKADHTQHYEKLLAHMTPGGSGGNAVGKAVEDDEDERSGTNGGGEEMKVFENLDKLKEHETLVEEVQSEVPDVLIHRAESGKLYLSATKDKSLPKHCQIGGFGTGTYCSADDPAPGVKWNVLSDKSLVQIDDSTMRQDATSISCMSLYKLLVTLEKVKKATEHRLSYVEVKRKEEGEELDGFHVTIRSAQKFKVLKNQNGQKDQPSGKNVFSRAIESVEGSSFLLVTFRWRYERVGCNLKVQKPYVVLGKSLAMEKQKLYQARISSMYQIKFEYVWGALGLLGT